MKQAHKSADLMAFGFGTYDNDGIRRDRQPDPFPDSKKSGAFPWYQRRNGHIVTTFSGPLPSVIGVDVASLVRETAALMRTLCGLHYLTWNISWDAA